MSLKKTSRLVLIKQLISKHEISNQEDLVRLLAEHGVKATQATVSRDLKQLNVAKGFTPSGHTCYVLPNEVFYRRPKAELPEETNNESSIDTFVFYASFSCIKYRFFIKSCRYSYKTRICRECCV